MKVVIISGEAASGKTTFAQQMAQPDTKSWNFPECMAKAKKYYENRRGEDLIIDMIFTPEQAEHLVEWIAENRNMFNYIYVISQYSVYGNVLCRKLRTLFASENHKDFVFHVRTVTQ